MRRPASPHCFSALKNFDPQGVDICPPGAYNDHNKEISFKPVTERSSRCGKPSESPGWWNRGGARPVNGLRRADRTARPSRDRRVSHPLSIGARMMVRVSERTSHDVNLGGIAETAVFVPWRGKDFFVCPPGFGQGRLSPKPPPGPWQGPGHLPPKQHQRRIYP